MALDRICLLGGSALEFPTELECVEIYKWSVCGDCVVLGVGCLVVRGGCVGSLCWRRGRRGWGE